MSLLPGLEIETRYSLQRNTVCFNRDINFHFFPPLRIFWWNLDVYMLDDMYVSICGDDFMTYGVFIVAQLLPKPPGFGLNRLACKLKNPHYFI